MKEIINEKYSFYVIKAIINNNFKTITKHSCNKYKMEQVTTYSIINLVKSLGKQALKRNICRYTLALAQKTIHKII
jgi:hypothetical protein